MINTHVHMQDVSEYRTPIILSLAFGVKRLQSKYLIARMLAKTQKGHNITTKAYCTQFCSVRKIQISALCKFLCNCLV